MKRATAASCGTRRSGHRHEADGADDERPAPTAAIDARARPARRSSTAPRSARARRSPPPRRATARDAVRLQRTQSVAPLRARTLDRGMFDRNRARRESRATDELQRASVPADARLRAASTQRAISRERVLPQMLTIFLLPRLGARLGARRFLQPRHRRLKIVGRHPRRVGFARDRRSPRCGAARPRARLASAIVAMPGRLLHAGGRVGDDVVRRVRARARQVPHRLRAETARSVACSGKSLHLLSRSDASTSARPSPAGHSISAVSPVVNRASVWQPLPPMRAALLELHQAERRRVGREGAEHGMAHVGRRERAHRRARARRR